MTPPLDQKVVVITGASRGLGEALAGAFALAGARLALCARTGDALAAVAARLQKLDAEVVAHRLDVRDVTALGALVREAEERWDGIDGLINNASILGSRVPLRGQSEEEWRRVIDVNLTGSFLAAQAVLPGMRARGSGSIVNITSGVGDKPRADWGAYAVSKWATEGFSYNLAEEEKDAGVRVNLVDPGSLRTAMRQAAYPDEDPKQQTPVDFATPVFLWLISDASRGVTGRRFDALSWRG